MAHHHHHSLAGQTSAAPAAAAKTATAGTVAVAPPALVFPPIVATGRAWGEPLMCAALTLVCFYRTCRRLVVRVTDWGVALRGMV